MQITNQPQNTKPAEEREKKDEAKNMRYTPLHQHNLRKKQRVVSLVIVLADMQRVVIQDYLKVQVMA